MSRKYKYSDREDDMFFILKSIYTDTAFVKEADKFEATFGANRPTSAEAQDHLAGIAQTYQLDKDLVLNFLLHRGTVINPQPIMVSVDESTGTLTIQAPLDIRMSELTEQWALVEGAQKTTRGYRERIRGSDNIELDIAIWQAKRRGETFSGISHLIEEDSLPGYTEPPDDAVKDYKYVMNRYERFTSRNNLRP